MLLGLSYVGFVSLGLPDTILGAAWPAIRADLALPIDVAGAAPLVTTGGVVLSSVASGAIRRRWGTSTVLILSTVFAAVALLVTSAAPSFGVVLGAAAIAGLGGGAIDACLNDHVARHHSAKHMNWLHACWGVGATVSPAVVSAVLARGASWRVAYLLLGIVELLLVSSFGLTRKAWDRDRVAPAADSSKAGALGARGSQIASLLLFYCYGGLEAGTGLWAASLLTETRGTSRALAGAGVAAYWGALCASRFLIGACSERLGPARVLRGSVWTALAAVSIMAIPSTPAGVLIVAMAALGAALGPIYPLTMHDTPQRFGRELGARMVGYQVAATSLGVASLPWLLALIATAVGLVWLPMLLWALAACVTALESARRRFSSGRELARRVSPGKPA